MAPGPPRRVVSVDIDGMRALVPFPSTPHDPPPNRAAVDVAAHIVRRFERLRGP